MKEKFVSLHQHRLKDNPEELKFARAWTRFSAHLRYLLDTRREIRPADPSLRDEQVAATVIQWLGSPVGQRFLRDLGYVKVGEEETG